MTSITFLQSLLFLLTLLICKSFASEILGCGGYIRSEVEIHFSHVRIKLLTLQGNLKYETECAPNNGYYFIPLYDKGDYVLQVAPPPGWSFEPEKRILKVDGETDPCSLGQDINFHFKGFAVVGRVVSNGSDKGPTGVSVALHQGERLLLRTVTAEGGNYVFTPLAAGKYVVRASHPTWKLMKDEVTVTVSDQNGDAGSSIIVAGYSLSGFVMSNGKPIMGVNFVLHTRNKLASDPDCKKEKLTKYIQSVDEPFLCHVASDSKGRFLIKNLAPGKYSLVPYFTTGATVYDFVPHVSDILIEHSDFTVEEQFKVKGCTLNGKVTSGPSVNGLSGAKVILDDEYVTTTNKKGEYSFPSVKFGKHSLSAKADGLEFGNLAVMLSLDETKVADLVPIKFKMCFSVTVENIKEESSVWTINIRSKGTNDALHSIQTDGSGIGCLYLANGNYVAEIMLSPQDEQAGIRFGPKEHQFTINNHLPVALSFSQFLGEIDGTVECLSACPTLTISMRPAGGGLGNPRKTVSSNGKFNFREVIPGEYIVTVDKEEWCWKAQALSVVVNVKNVQIVFSQTGYRLTLNASHRTSLNYVTSTGTTGSLQVPEGTSRECVAAPGKYVFSPSGCHRFGSTSLTWETSSPHLLSLIATHHQITGNLKSTEAGPFNMHVYTSTGEDSILGPLTALEDDKAMYAFAHWATEGEAVTLTPQSPTNLFQYEPPVYQFTVPNDCMLNVVTFLAERALFLKGFVKPPLKGVTITVDEGHETNQTFTTNADGLFIVGPLDKSKNYIISAEKVGYIMSPPSQKVDLLQKASEVIKMNFEAYKLAEIIVQIVNLDGVPLESVLVSTSGGKDYRQNSLTGVDGTIAFQSLMPGEYFLRPIMKEYTFEPSSKMVTIKEGATVNFSVSGRRVAYSIFGESVSLNHEAESKVVVEVVGTDEKCRHIQEEAMSDESGQFRIRGLVPKCNYVLRLKDGASINTHISHILPTETSLSMESSDLTSVRIIAMRHFPQMDVAVIVNTAPTFLSTLTLELYREDNPDFPIHATPVGAHPFVMLPPLIIDKETYFIEVKSSLSQSRHTYTLPQVTFVANSSFKTFHLEFSPTVKAIEEEISRGTVFGFIFFIVLVTLGFNYTRVQPFVEQGIAWYSNQAAIRAKNGVAHASLGDSPRVEALGARKRIKHRKT